MYSANGTGCRLTYIWLVRARCRAATRCRRCGPRSVAGPRSTRADQDRRADRVGRRGDLLRRRPGCAAGRCRWRSPARPPGPAAAPARRRPGRPARSGGVDVVVEHGPALGVEVQAEARHVALHDRDGHGRVRPAPRHRHQQAGPQHQRRAPAAGYAGGGPATAGADGRQRPPAAAATSSPPATRDGERDQRRAAERGQPQQRGVALAEREPPPREPAERGPVAQRLLRRPTAARSAAATRQRHRSTSGLTHAAGRAQQRRGQRPAAPDSSTHGSQPACRLVQVSSGTKNTSPVEQAEPGAGPQPPPVHRGGQQRHPDRGEPPQPVRRERQQQRRPGGDAPAARRPAAGSGRRGAGGAGAAAPPRHRSGRRRVTSITARRLPGRRVTTASSHGHEPPGHGIGARPADHAPMLPGPSRPVRQEGVTSDLRSDPTRAGCPRRAVVYWPRVPPCPYTG